MCRGLALWARRQVRASGAELGSGAVWLRVLGVHRPRSPRLGGGSRCCSGRTGFSPPCWPRLGSCPSRGCPSRGCLALPLLSLDSSQVGVPRRPAATALMPAASLRSLLAEPPVTLRCQGLPHLDRAPWASQIRPLFQVCGLHATRPASFAVECVTYPQVPGTRHARPQGEAGPQEGERAQLRLGPSLVEPSGRRSQGHRCAGSHSRAWDPLQAPGLWLKP